MSEQVSLGIRREKINLDNQDVENFGIFLEQQQAKLSTMEEENDNIQRLISGYPELAEKLGLVVSEEENKN